MRDLIEIYKMKKIEAAAKMKLTPAAITQYIRGARGAMLVDEISKSEETMEILSELSKALVNNSIPEEAMVNMLCKACMALRATGICACTNWKAK